MGYAASERDRPRASIRPRHPLTATHNCRFEAPRILWKPVHLDPGYQVIIEGDWTVITNATHSRFSFTVGLFVMGLLMAGITCADCVKDLRGEVYCGAGRCIVDSKGTVWCSRHYDGDAKITSNGQVLCGVGQCAKNSAGQIFCSSQVGGAVLIDSGGRVRCYGQCEPASADNCENTRADSAGS